LVSFLDSMIELKIIQQLTKDSQISNYPKQRVFNNIQVVRNDRLSAPTSVSIHITQFCPKECKHCVTSSSSKINRSNELTTEQWFSVFEKLKTFGCTSIVFTGGDCFARKDIIDILKKADELGFLLAVLSDYDGMQRNRLIEISKLKHLVEFQMSLDGANAETHDWLRGEGSFKQSLERMFKLSELNIPYTISVVIHKNNLSEVEAIADLCRQYKAYNLYLAPLCPYGRGRNLTDILLNDDELWELGQKYLKLIKSGKANPGNPFWNENLDKIDDKNFKPYNLSLDAVSTGYFNLSIDWKGDCFLDTKFRSQNILNFGNILKDNIEDIWNNEKLNNVRKLSNPEILYVHQHNALLRLVKDEFELIGNENNEF
jgi:MoaA/NifB/PqqE/SkfB family radical SAM enzyme